MWKSALNNGGYLHLTLLAESLFLSASEPITELSANVEY